MIKLEVTERFTLQRFDELKDIERAGTDTYGQLYVGDKFYCEKDMAEYLLGNNKLKRAVGTIKEELNERLEVIPDEKPMPNAVEVKIPQEVIKSLGKKVAKLKTAKKKSTK